jgi:hypothetical protein
MSSEQVQPASSSTGGDTSNTNGVHQSGADAASTSPPSDSDGAAKAPVDRAEQLVEQVAQKVSSFTATWGRRAWSVVSRVREEAEDMWSEAQSIRRGDQK